MDDASCSGSTPFKSLVDHSAQDRSLHQDRFSAVPSSQHGFRSATPNTSAQAQETFGAFLNSNGSGPIPTRNPLMPEGLALRSTHLAEQHARQFSPNISQTAPQIPTPATFGGNQIRQQHLGGVSRATSWAQDFARFAQGSPNSGNHATSFSNIPHQPYHSPGFAPNTMAFSSRLSLFGPMSSPAPISQQGPTNIAATAEADFDLEMDRWIAAHGDQIEDVDAIMKELARQMEQEQLDASESQEQRNGDRSSSTANASAGEIRLQNEQFTKQTRREAPSDERAECIGNIDSQLRPDNQPDTSRLDINRLHETTSAEAASQGQSEISEAARQILESVQHEQGEKWKNSRFLLLMRDFRDGNKDIVDNEILDTRTDADRPREQTTETGD